MPIKDVNMFDMAYDLTVIVPVYNEQGTILELLKKVVNAPALSALSIQFIVVDDGSTDGTAELLKNSSYPQDSRFILLSHAKNLGKGSAIRTGLAKALGKYTIIQDADLEYDPNDIASLLNHAEKNNLKTVYGSRNLNPQTKRGSFAFYWGGKTISWLTNLFFSQKITDEPTCYKLIRTDVLKGMPLTCQRFEFCPEVTAMLAMQGVKIIELPISYFPRGKEQGKKIGFWDWFEAVWTLVRLRVNINKDWVMALMLFVFPFLLYMTTWHHLLMGYETETAQSALAMFSGGFQVFRAGIGAVIMYLPFVALGKLLYPQNVMAFLTIVPVFYSALCVFVLYFVSGYLTSKKSARLAVTLLTAAASLMWPYSRIGMEYQAMLWLCILLLCLLSWRKSLSLPIFTPLENINNKFDGGKRFFWNRWVENAAKNSLMGFSGVALAMLTFSKSYGVVFALPALIFVGIELWQKNQLKTLFKPKFFIALFGPTVLVLAANFIVNFAIYGRGSGAYNLNQEFLVTSWWEGFFGTFFSAGKSILLYSPLLILSLWYWGKFWQKDKASAVFIGLSFLELLLITAPFSHWSDETLSVRKLMPVVPLLHLPLLYAFESGVWSKFKKAVWVLAILVSLYFQFINSFYPYWLQLVMFRPYNLDELSVIRYNPEFSALALNNRLFISYLSWRATGQDRNFVYQERSSMRCCTGEPAGDPFLVKINMSLKDFDRPYIYLVLGKSNKRKKSLALAEAAALALFAGVLAANLDNRRKEEYLEAM